MNIFEHIISTIAPHQCVRCGNEGRTLCGPCIQNLPPADDCCYVCNCRTDAGLLCRTCARRSALSSVVALTPYRDEAKRLLYQLKFDRMRAAATDIGEAIVGQLSQRSLPPDLVVTHVPTANSRVRQRGYDQSALIAKAVAAGLGARYIPLLRRTGDIRQLGQDRATRRRQMEAAFRPINTQYCHEQSVLLIDDVFTTGATVESAAAAMTGAGAADVHVVVFARA